MRSPAPCVLLHLPAESALADQVAHRRLMCLAIASARDVVDHLDAIERIGQVAVSDGAMKQPWSGELLEYLDSLRSTEIKFITLAPPPEGALDR